MRKLALLALWLATPIMAEGYKVDAFGIFEDAPSPRDQWAGVQLACKNDQCEETVIKPQKLFNIESIFGQKSLTAGKSNAMSMGILTDEIGNLVDLEPVYHYALSGDEMQIGRAELGISTTMFMASEKAGQYSTSISAGHLQSEQMLYRQNADIQSVDFAITTNLNDISQGATHILETAPLRDRYGNAAPIGTSLNIFMIDELGRSAISPLSAQGANASQTLYTTTMHGRYQTAINLGRKTRPMPDLFIDEERIISLENINAKLYPTTKFFNLKIGAILTNLNHMVQDAVPITVKLTQANGHENQYRVWSFVGGIEVNSILKDDAFPIHIQLDSDIGTAELTLNENDVDISE